MSLLISKESAETIKDFQNQSPVKVNELAKLLQSLDSKSFKKRPDVSLLNESGEDIYILKYKNIRLFFAFSNDDLVLLSVNSK